MGASRFGTRERTIARYGPSVAPSSAARKAGRRPRTTARSGLGEDLAQLGREAVRVAGLAVLATEEAAVVAREDDRRCPEALGHGERAAIRQLTLRLGAGGQHDPGRGRPQRLDVRFVSACTR